jgi:hypothetical protein
MVREDIEINKQDAPARIEANPSGPRTQAADFFLLKKKSPRGGSRSPQDGYFPTNQTTPRPS